MSQVEENFYLTLFARVVSMCAEKVMLVLEDAWCCDAASSYIHMSSLGWPYICVFVRKVITSMQMSMPRITISFSTDNRG